MMRVLCNCGHNTRPAGNAYAHAETCPINPRWAETQLLETLIERARRFAAAQPAPPSAIDEGSRVIERIDEPAKRFDAGKSRIDLIPPEFIEALGRHYAVGAAKYAERNWEKGMSWSRCYASAMRHLLAFWGGEEIDAETGTPHVVSAAWNLAALHWYGLHRAGTDDRPHFPIASA